LKNILKNINKVFDNRVRLGIMSALMVNESLDFKSLKGLLGVTDGNLASHIKSLQKAGYVVVLKQFIANKPNTSYQLSIEGRNAFKAHIDALEQLLKIKGD
jgi:DNA-binding MarR family transcriptional regulator